MNNPTASVSRKIKRGKNTTRNVELFSLSEESYIVDTPGFNLNKIEFESKFIGNLFPEIRLQLNQKDCKCKFRDCLHLSEPGCGLDKNFERYIFYKELVEASMNHHYQNLAD